VAKIILKDPQSPYHCEIDTDVMEVEVRESYLGFLFITDQGEELAVSMRDGGFELHYFGHRKGRPFEFGWFDLKDGRLRSPKNE
jgi:hypothetical protein